MSDRYRIAWTRDDKPRMRDILTDDILSWTDMERTLNGYEDTTARLREYAEHKQHCDKYPPVVGDYCTCGLDELLEELDDGPN